MSPYDDFEFPEDAIYGGYLGGITLYIVPMNGYLDFYFEAMRIIDQRESIGYNTHNILAMPRHAGRL
jgi:hypothetical protein